MDYELIFGTEVTLEDLYFWNSQGFEFVIEDGTITEVHYRGKEECS